MKTMKHEFLAAAAAVALIAGTGGVHAQSPQAPKAEQAQPGGGAAAPMQNRDAAPKTGLDARGGAQAQTPAGKADMKTQGGAQAQGTQQGTQSGGADTKKDSAGQMDRDGAKQAQDRDRPGQKQDTARDSKPGADSERVQLNEQQRTRISQTIKTENRNLRRVERTNINFNINVGAVVPRTIELYPLPAPIVSVVPAYRGYLYIVVGDDLLIIHPRTHEIVAVIAA